MINVSYLVLIKKISVKKKIKILLFLDTTECIEDDPASQTIKIMYPNDSGKIIKMIV